MNRIIINLCACCVLLLVSSCGVSFDLPDSNQPENDVLSDSDEVDIIAEIKKRTILDGAEYKFDQLEAVFTDVDEGIEVTFNYTDPNVIGGAPVAVISRSSREILAITYTR